MKELRSLGLFPNLIICRSDRELNQEIIDKVSLFCNVPKDSVFQSIDLDSIYKVPLNFHDQGLDEKIIESLGIWATRPNVEDLKNFVFNFDNPLRKVKIGVVGKYTELVESYKSLDEALKHAAINLQLELDTVYVDSEELESGDVAELLKDVQGVLVPGGFGTRGTEGKIKAIQYARENNLPFFGICLGMQLAIIEYARNISGIENATSEEFDGSGENLIHYMEGQSSEGAKGASMRLGAYSCTLAKDSKTFQIYNESQISERHRHRLEVNNDFREKLEQDGLVISGVNEELNLVEVVEISENDFFIACQYHPEFKSKPHESHPLFKSFVDAADKFNKK